MYFIKWTTKEKMSNKHCDKVKYTLDISVNFVNIKKLNNSWDKKWKLCAKINK